MYNMERIMQAETLKSCRDCLQIVSVKMLNRYGNTVKCNRGNNRGSSLGKENAEKR